MFLSANNPCSSPLSPDNASSFFYLTDGLGRDSVTPI
jgi:hypothetical protein